jgi:predicted dehydrogenase
VAKKLEGGPLLINLIHEIDCLRFIIGEIESVQAIASNTTRGFEVEDTVSIIMRFENGELGSFMLSDSIASSYLWEMASGQALYFPHQPGDCYFFGGRKGTLAVPGMTYWMHDKDTEHWQHPFVSQQISLDGSRTYENQLNHFIAVIEGIGKPIVSANDVTRTLAATMAIDLAAREQRIVYLQEAL